ncbi:MAG TPA: PD-(D/E)XK nuclease-like domain-containing protein [Polyangiaceae bacterium]
MVRVIDPKRTYAPGLYPRGSIDYGAVKAVNFSTLKHMAHSPKRYRYRLRHGGPETDGMRFGNSAHTAVLEPNRFMTHYAMFVPPADEKTGKKKSDRRGTKAWDAFAKENEGKTIVKQPEYMRALELRDAVRSDPAAMKYLEIGQPEVAMVWVDQETGLLCKGRVDWISDDPADTIVDLKSSGDVVPFNFGRTAARLLYHWQVSFYADGYEVITGRPAAFKVVAVEQEGPHDVVVYNMPDEVLDIGRDEYRKRLLQLKDCLETNAWPGYANGAEMDFCLPAWLTQAEDELQELGLEM